MSKGDGQTANITEAGRARLSDREARRAEALRANLLRRKAQARERDDPSPVGEGTGDG